jgi:hypothetical protein
VSHQVILTRKTRWKTLWWAQQDLNLRPSDYEFRKPNSQQLRQIVVNRFFPLFSMVYAEQHKLSTTCRNPSEPKNWPRIGQGIVRNRIAFGVFDTPPRT